MQPEIHSLLIRDVRSEDQNDIQRLAWLLWDHHHKQRSDRFRTANEIISTMQPTAPPFQLAERTWVADVSGQVTGYVKAVLRNAPQSLAYRPQRVVVILEIAVVSTFRKQGTGRALLSTVKDWARESAAEAIEVPVFGFNEAAISLYETTGFAPWLLHLRCDLNE